MFFFTRTKRKYAKAVGGQRDAREAVYPPAAAHDNPIAPCWSALLGLPGRGEAKNTRYYVRSHQICSASYTRHWPEGCRHLGRMQNLMQSLPDCICALSADTFGSGCLCSLHVLCATTAGHLGPVLPDHGGRTCLHPQQLLQI